MNQPEWDRPLEVAHQAALDFLHGLPERPVAAAAGWSEMQAALGGPLPEQPSDPARVVAEFAERADPGVIASQSGRFFGFVIGGASPAALAADWLVSTWDQNAGLSVIGPAVTAAEDIAGRWLVELFGLPVGTSYGFVTGAQMATFTALAAARHRVLATAGWDVERAGLIGAPPIRVLAGADRHDTIDRALRFLGLGTDCVRVVASDDHGAMQADDLAAALAESDGPTIVSAQVGGINGGATDPVGAVCDLAHARGAWVHVDGAFGLWAAAAPALGHLVGGIERADSWATDAHKWLNVPYDSGLVFCADPEAHRAAMQVRAAYLVHADSSVRDPLDFNPEFSRRARGVAVYAALRALGRRGVAELVERCCAMAAEFGRRLGAEDDIELLAPVSLNQVLIRFRSPDGDHDAHTRRVIAAVQAEGVSWPTGTTWRGRAGMRLSVSNATTDLDDVEASLASILRAHRGG